MEQNRKHKILIVDDDRQVHDATVFALADVTVRNRPMAFLHAYTGAEARTILAGSKDVAVILLDGNDVTAQARSA